MKLSFILLLLHLWVGVEVSVSQNVCSTLPKVPHAHVSEETKKTVYQEGDVIHFSCEPGYMSDQTSKFVCTTGGWLVVRQGKCFSCAMLPDVPNAHVTEETRKAQYQEGDVIHFACEPGYTSGLAIKYICASDGWQAIREGSCYLSDSSCDRPPADEGLTVKGLPENYDPIRPHHILIFSCGHPGHSLNGSSVLICGKDGQWNNPFPSCIDRTCKLGVMHPHLHIAGFPTSNETMTAGHKLRFLCSGDHELVGSTEIKCLENGQWNFPFPTCIVSRIIVGTLDCGRPPHLLNGDTKTTRKDQYSHNEKLEYVCQIYYIMEGGPYKTCINGEWTGQITCLKPCTVNREDMNRHNIFFRYSRDDRLYSQHGDYTTFMCVRGTRPVGTLGMRQSCVNGVIQLPTCM